MVIYCRLTNSSFIDDAAVFFIGICQAKKSIEEVRQLLSTDRQFAILMPTGLLPEISREENIGETEIYSPTREKQVHGLSKVVLSQEGETWLVRINDQPRFTEVLLAEQVGCNQADAANIFITSIEDLVETSSVKPDWHDHNAEADEATRKCEVYVGQAMSPRITRKSSRLMKATPNTPAPSNSVELELPEDNVETESDDPLDPNLEPINTNPATSIFNQFQIEPIKLWIGKQLENQDISPAALKTVIKAYDNYPDGLLAIPSTKGGSPRLIVPVAAQENLIKQAHLDIHHQSHRKVQNILYPLYWWPRMDRDIERVCKACSHCQSGKMRRERIKSEFDALAPQSKAGPRQHYGMDFYGLAKGEILVIVDLFTRETILQWLPTRKQEQVAQTILRRVIFERVVPLSIRSDSALNS